MLGVLLSIALLFGVYDGVPESIESDSQAELALDEQLALTIVCDEPVLPAAVRMLAAEHAVASCPSRALTRIFRPPRS